MVENNKEKIIQFIDNSVLLFFGIIAIFIPISIAAVNSCFGFIFMFFLVKAFLLKPDVKKEMLNFFSDRFNLAVLVFYICIGFSIMLSDAPWKSFIAWSLKWGKGVLLFYFARLFLDRRHVRILMGVTLVSAFFVCIDGMYQLATGRDFMLGYAINRSELVVGVRATFNHYNNFATFLAVMFFFCMGFMIYARKSRLRFYLRCLALIILVMLLLTYSRGGWLAFILTSVMFIFMLKDKKNKRIGLALVGIFLLALALVPLSRDRILSTIRAGGDNCRYDIWQDAFGIFQRSPILGNGIGRFMDQFNKSTTLGAQYAHNCYLQMLVETGIVGLASFLFMVGLVLVSGYKRVKEYHEPVFSGLFFGLVVFLIHAFFDTQLYSTKLVLLFWILFVYTTIYVSDREFTGQADQLLNLN